ncbi:MAG: iron chelate uptake ABC transporter family permease subunit [Acidimicrobiia bacterium]
MTASLRGAVPAARPAGRGPASAPASAAAPARGPSVLAGLGALLGATFLLSLALGSVWIPVGEVVAALAGSAPEGSATLVVVRDIRLPRALTALAAGAALGTAGLQMQTLFRNPLADPFVLGISSGASLGVALVILAGGGASAGAFAGHVSALGDMSLAAAAIAGAMAVLAVVLAVSARLASPVTILVVGLMCGYAISALVTVLVARADAPQLQRFIAWGLGSFSGVTWARLGVFLPVVGAGLALAAASTKQLNALLLGERYARSMGLAVRRTRVLAMVGASVLGGAVTAFCGPVAFVGIAVPHLCRALLGTSDHRLLAPAVVLAGGSVALIAQIASLMPGRAGVLPLNAVTALLGAPVVIAILLRDRRGAFTG